MLNRKSATKGEIEEMVKLLRGKFGSIKNIDYSRDDEDDIGFVSAQIGKVLIQFQDREKPCFVSFCIDRDSYDVGYPEGELYEQLQKITDIAKEKRMYGKTFLEKINS